MSKRRMDGEVGSAEGAEPSINVDKLKRHLRSQVLAEKN